MIIRALSSTTIGLAVTLGLFYVMHFLIATGEEILTEPRQRQIVRWVSLPDPPDTIVETPRPQKIDKPPVPPVIELVESADTEGVGVAIPATTPLPLPGTQTLAGFSNSDGPLINIIKVQPQYPAAAASRDLSGTVIVQFDVSAMGTVENVIVVESTNRVFNKAAIQAAYRFKYKPRTVDGIQYGAKALQQLFRFEMEDQGSL